MIVAYFLCCILFLMFMKSSLWIEVFWLNMVKVEFICNMCTIQSYLAAWGLRRILSMVLSKFMRKSRREEREMMWQGEGRERAISAMVLPKLLRLKFYSLDWLPNWLIAKLPISSLKRVERKICIVAILLPK